MIAFVMSEEALIEVLQRAYMGEHPEMLLLDLMATADHHRVVGDDPQGGDDLEGDPHEAEP